MHHVGKKVMSICPIAGEVTSAKVVSAGFRYWKATIAPFVIIKYLGGGSLRPHSYLFSWDFH